jgi:hypothetical protein
MKQRDLLLLDLPDGSRLVVACDVAGGIGPLAGDQVPAPGYVVGRLTARVALMELLAAGARPIGLANLPAVAPEGAGAEILRGVLAEARLAGLDEDAVTGSFEKNIPVRQTALGVTAFGLLPGDSSATGRPAGATAGDLIVAIGRPKVGAEVDLDDPELPDLPLTARLAADPLIHELLPVGSRGIRAELLDLAAGAGLHPRILPDADLDLAKTAGPSTVLLAALPPAALPGLALTLDRPWTLVAELHTIEEADPHERP